MGNSNDVFVVGVVQYNQNLCLVNVGMTSKFIMIDKAKKYWCICGSQKPITYVKQDYTFKALKNGVIYSFTIKDFEMPTCQDCGANYFGSKEDEQMTKAIEEGDFC